MDTPSPGCVDLLVSKNVEKPIKVKMSVHHLQTTKTVIMGEVSPELGC